jgi:hypothetical protein
MRVPYDEVLANYVSPDSCGGSGNTATFGLDFLTGAPKVESLYC